MTHSEPFTDLSLDTPIASWENGPLRRMIEVQYDVMTMEMPAGEHDEKDLHDAVVSQSIFSLVEKHETMDVADHQSVRLELTRILHAFLGTSPVAFNRPRKRRLAHILKVFLGREE